MCVVCSVWLRHGRRATARWRPSPCTCRQVDGEQGPARRREQVRLHHLVDAQVERARRALLDQGAVDPLVQRQVPLEAPALVLLLRLRLRTRCHLHTHRTACCLRLLLRLLLLRGLPCDRLRRRRGWSGGGWGGAWGGARLLGGRGLKHVGPVHARSIGHAACGRRSIAHAACGRRGLGGRRRGLRIGGHRRPRHPLDGTAALAAAAALATALATAPLGPAALCRRRDRARLERVERVHDQRRDARAREGRHVVEPVGLRVERAEHVRALRDPRLQQLLLRDPPLELQLHRLDRRALLAPEALLLAQQRLRVRAVQLHLPQRALPLLLLFDLGGLLTLAHRSARCGL